MTSSLALVLVFGGAAVCAELALRGGYRERSNQDDPEYLELAHYATSTWSAQQPGKTHFDTVVEVLKVETQTVAGTNYRLTLKVAESTCELTSTYNKDTCQANANAAQRTCTTVIYRNLQGEKSISSFECAAA
ncbi:Salivary cystatin-L2 [Ixodes scapularis]|uniref:Salivary cystatin-L2 n=1 Tax=Ixodes scapularis TaxID=6945 RepID=CYTL2_IXOSC|nr:RecName: Full=Salivary cystatin-L2; AltName: Full=Sialostatin-L2; Flags: Precursor [Ixodes scapularis]EEC07263.1 secreted cystatin [Ixodes scapularis]|eukprot:XP_002434439.1 secreted cystatin [Ixodes scapularis]